MATATTKERQFTSQLSQARGRIKTRTAGNTAANDSPNIVVTMLFLGLAGVGDLVGLIPIAGYFVKYPALGIIWLWRFSRHQTGPKKDPTLQLLLSSLGSALPFVPTCIILVLYTHGMDTKLGKATIGKLSTTKIKKIKK